MNMDPPIVNEASFSTANQVEYSLEGIWPFGGSEEGGLGSRMSGFGTFGDGLNMDLSVDQYTVTDHSGTGVSGKRNMNDLNFENQNPRLVSMINDNYLNSNGKRMKGSGAEENSSEAKVEAESSSKTANKATEHNSSPDPPKDYIHVRARRGEATDSHSLAERARREKISERMKILQDLVPGCNKVLLTRAKELELKRNWRKILYEVSTFVEFSSNSVSIPIKVIGKALVLDEIINYIQSLQRQVEILSMKLEAVNSKMNSTIANFPSKELTTQAFDATAMMFGSQPTREYVQSLQPEWLHMQIGSSYERAG